jgi:aquaporin Z
LLVAKNINVKNATAYILAQVIGGFLASLVLLAILSGVTGDASAGVAEYSRATYGLGANDVPAFLSVGAALGIEVVLTALFLFVIFNATSSQASTPSSRSGHRGVSICGPSHWCAAG